MKPNGLLLAQHGVSCLLNPVVDEATGEIGPLCLGSIPKISVKWLHESLFHRPAQVFQNLLLRNLASSSNGRELKAVSYAGRHLKRSLAPLFEFADLGRHELYHIVGDRFCPDPGEVPLPTPVRRHKT